MGDGGVVDWATLAQQFDGDQVIIQSILQAFIECAEDYRRDIHAALAVRSLPHLQAVGHKVKSAAHSIGAKALGDSCGELELSAKRGDSAKVLTQAEDVLNLLDVACESIRRRLLQADL